jgi:hypothetical protein
VAETLAYLTEAHPNLPDPETFLGGLPGVHLCALPEKEFYTRAAAVGAPVEVAKEVYLGIWTHISDAKTRKRRPNGSIITPEEEEQDRLRLIREKEEKAAIWAEREKHMRSEF